MKMAEANEPSRKYLIAASSEAVSRAGEAGQDVEADRADLEAQEHHHQVRGGGHQREPGGRQQQQRQAFGAPAPQRLEEPPAGAQPAQGDDYQEQVGEDAVLVDDQHARRTG